MPLLTPGEYDDLPAAAKQALAGVMQQPLKDKKSNPFRKRFGRFMNGEIDADPRATAKVGYGTGSRKVGK
jgi:hypothetical protein